MLKNKIKTMRKEIDALFPKNPLRSVHEDHKRLKYILADWDIEDIRKVVFPEGRECFDPEDESLMSKWNNTNWISRDFLKLLTVEELKRLQYWMEKRSQERGLSNAKK